MDPRAGGPSDAAPAPPRLWALDERELVELVRREEERARESYGRQVAAVAELLSRGTAASLGYASTSALLMDLSRISRRDADQRCQAADLTQPHPSPGGEVVPALLPALGAALADGAVNAEQVARICRALTRIPADIPPELIAEVERPVQDVPQPGRTGCGSCCARCVKSSNRTRRPHRWTRPRTRIRFAG